MYQTLRFAAAAVAVVVGCSDRSGATFDEPDAGGDASRQDVPQGVELMIAPPHVSLFIHERKRLVARLILDDGSGVEPDCRWSTNDQVVATVQADGTILAHAVGATTAAAECRGLRAEANVEVIERPTPRVEIVDENITLALPHQTYQPQVDAHSTDGVALAATDLSWSSTDASVVKAQNGVIWPVGAGDALVQAEFDGASDEVQVRVLGVASISIVPSGGTLMLHDGPLQLGVEYRGDDGTPLSPDVPIEWAITTNDTNANLEPNGVLRTLAPGPFTVTVESAGRVAAADFVVDVKFTDLACKMYNCCAVDADGRGYCFGRNRFGSLGVDGAQDVAYPQPLLGPHRFETIDVGLWYACALDHAGAPYCWGWNAWGRLGYGEPNTGYPQTGENAEPTLVPSIAAFRSLATGGSGTYALTPDGEMYVWGLAPPVDDLNSMPYSGPSHPSPTLLDSGPWSELVGSANAGYMCAVDEDARLWCRGRNHYGQLGQGDPDEVGEWFEEFVQYELPTSADIVDVAIGQHNMCVLDEFGGVWCSGLNIYGALGLPYEHPYSEDNRSDVPRKLEFGRTFDTLTGNTRSTYCGISKKDVHCWGWNGNCQLGSDAGNDSSNPDHWAAHSHTPVHLDFLPDDWTKIALSAWAGCLIDSAGELWCWGLDETHGDPLGSSLNCDPTLQRVLPYN